MSDMRVGTLISKQWLAARADQVEAQMPDLVILLGDSFVGHKPEEELTAVLRRLSAPLGVTAPVREESPPPVH
jgi:predicted MPP superfamily phosphohydrolase